MKYEGTLTVAGQTVWYELKEIADHFRTLRWHAKIPGLPIEAMGARSFDALHLVRFELSSYLVQAKAEISLPVPVKKPSLWGSIFRGMGEYSSDAGA